jgi:hypothetical protein
VAERSIAPTLYLGGRVSAPKVRILPDPPICYHARMGKKIVVEKEKFDAVLSALLKSKPIKRSKIKTTGRRGPKTPLFQKQ